MSGGPLLYQNYDIRPIGSTGSFSSVVIGFSTVEVLGLLEQSAPARAVEAPPAMPPCDRMPVAVVPGDYDGDGQLDLWTLEACGGNWIALGSDYSVSMPAEEVLPPDPGPQPYADYFDTSDGAVVVAGTSLGAHFLRRKGSVWSAPSWLAFPGPVSVMVAKPWVLLAPGEASSTDLQFIVQGDEALHVVTVSDAGPFIERTLTQTIEPPYLRPFAAFEHLTTLNASVCAGTALGIGLFSTYASNQPRRLQIIHPSGETFTVTEPAVGLDEVATIFPLAYGGEASPIELLGLLGRRGTQHRFVLATLTNCSEFEALGELNVEFDLRTPPLPEGYADRFVPQTNGVRLVSFMTSSARHRRGSRIRVVPGGISL